MDVRKEVSYFQSKQKNEIELPINVDRPQQKQQKKIEREKTAHHDNFWSDKKSQSVYFIT